MRYGKIQLAEYTDLAGKIIVVGDDGVLGVSDPTIDEVALITDIENVSGNLNSRLETLEIDPVTLSQVVSISSNLQSQISLKANDSDVVHINGNETIYGIKTFANDTVINGNLYVNGTEFIVNTESVSAADNLIVINAGEVGAGVTAGKAGIEVDRGTLTNYQFVFDETDDTFKVGEIGDLVALAARETSPTSNRVPYWDTTSATFKTDRSLTLDSSSNLSLIGKISTTSTADDTIETAGGIRSTGGPVPGSPSATDCLFGGGVGRFGSHVSAAHYRMSTYSTPASGTLDNAPIGEAGIVRCPISGGLTITGLQGGVEGRWLILYNTSTANTVTLAHENASSDAANQIRTQTNADVTFSGRRSVMLMYDTAISKWVPLLFGL